MHQTKKKHGKFMENYRNNAPNKEKQEACLEEVEDSRKNLMYLKRSTD